MARFFSQSNRERYRKLASGMISLAEQHQLLEDLAEEVDAFKREARCSSHLKPIRAAFLALAIAPDRMTVSKTFKIHDRVSWNSEAGRVSGTIIRVHTRKFELEGYMHHASPDDPQYEIKSSKTDHIAFHKGSALTKLGD